MVFAEIGQLSQPCQVKRLGQPFPHCRKDPVQFKCLQTSPVSFRMRAVGANQVYRQRLGNPLDKGAAWGSLQIQLDRKSVV